MACTYRGSSGSRGDGLPGSDSVLAQNCRREGTPAYQGPFYKFDTAESYIDSLKSDPPVGLDYLLLRSYENDSSACLIYQFSKPGISTSMAQQFEVKNGRIAKILLIFDTSVFT